MPDFQSMDTEYETLVAVPKVEQLPSITELSNSITRNIDLADADGIVSLLRQTDAQIINGFQDFPAIADRGVLDQLSQTVDRMLEILDRPGQSRLVIAGAGTSGRLAMLAAREINTFLTSRDRPPLAEFCMAGGAGALIRAEEGAEDLPEHGVRDLKEAIGDAENVVYIGVTCGMSAPYIAGQLDWAAERDNTLCILLGFSTPARARRINIEGWDKTFADVSNRLVDDKRHIVLTPVVGPEAITGSTRMKSGTATGIILQLLMFCSFARYGVLTDEELSQIGFSSERTLDSMRQFLLQYETARNCAYLESDHLADIIELAGDALKAGRNIYYLGSGNHGILGLIDASECPPTYGATFEDVRGYLAGGWSTLLPDGVEPPKASIPEDDSLFSFDLPDFESQKLPQVGEGDLVIGIGKANMNAEVQRLVKAAKAQGAKTAAILATPENGHDWLDVDIFLPLTMPMPGYVKGGSAFSEMAMKLILNGITTGAHVLAGKVFSNYMIDLRITNSKLYERAIKIICKLMEVNRHHAETSLLSAIYQTDSLHPAQAQAPVSQHVATAAPRGKVVPAAMLIATGNFSCSEAEQALAKEPIIRQLLEQYLTNR